jgi:effector-binding domain-containing protein
VSVRRASPALVPAVLLLIAGCGDDQPADFVPPAGETAPLTAEPEVTVRMLEPATVLVLPKTGSYDVFWSAVEEARGVLRRNGVELVGSPRCAYYDLPRPAETPLDERRFEVWLPVTENMIPPPGFRIDEVEGGEAAYMTYKGPIRTGERPDYGTLFEYVHQLGRNPVGPVIEVYHWEAGIPPEEYMTEIFLRLSEPVEETAAGEEPPTEITDESEETP